MATATRTTRRHKMKQRGASHVMNGHSAANGHSTSSEPSGLTIQDLRTRLFKKAVSAGLDPKVAKEMAAVAAEAYIGE